MEEQKKGIMAVLIGIVVVVLLSSFGFSLFVNTPAVELPEVTDKTVADPDQSSSPEPGDSGQITLVEVNVKTVQEIIASLERSKSYSRTIIIETFWDGGSLATRVNAWGDGDCLRLDMLRDGSVRHVIMTPDTVYIWYDEDRSYYTGKLGTFTADGEQSIPTYEEILLLDEKEIAQADYVEREGYFCIYVETEANRLGYVKKYWVDVKTGLLVFAETHKNDVEIYRMSSFDMKGANFSDDVFQLPDATVVTAG